MPTLKVSKKSSRKGRTLSKSRTYSPHGGVTTLANLIANPCHAPLTAPQYGASDGGYLARFASYNSINVNEAAGTHGYVIWYPDYTGRGTLENENGNLFIFKGLSDEDKPTNGTSDPLGSGTLDSASGTFIRDPALNFCDEGIVQDARTAAACMKMTYTGRNDSLAGRISYLENVPRGALIAGEGTSAGTVQSFHVSSAKTVRTPMDTIEVKHRPSDGSEMYRECQDVHKVSALSNSTYGQDYCFVQGEVGVNRTVLASGTPSSLGHGIGFAWSNMEVGTTFTLEFTKAIEWRPQLNSGLQAATPTQAPGGENIVNKAIHYLDKHMPHWQSTAIAVAKSGAAQIANYAFSGPANAALRAGMATLML